ncbi:MAG: hypothetical protein K2X29_05625, partial [Candidatus Obscuribacterales bacterium]|nr:hypothetical protein [Candidatus Obscuribacterales bacterium]
TRLGFVLLGIFSVFVGKTFLPMEWSGLLVAAAVFFVIAGFVVSIVIQQTKEASEKEDLLFSQTETIDKLKKRRRVHI